MHLIQCEFDLGGSHVFSLGGKKSSELTLTQTEDTYEVIDLLFPSTTSSSGRRLGRNRDNTSTSTSEEEEVEVEESSNSNESGGGHANSE